MITSTVPPPNSSGWPDGPEVSVKLHSVVPLSTTPAAANATVTPTLGLPTLMDPGSNCNLVSSGGGDEGLSKDSPDSDGQGGVIIMDINSKKRSKVGNIQLISFFTNMKVEFQKIGRIHILLHLIKVNSCQAFLYIFCTYYHSKYLPYVDKIVKVKSSNVFH